MPFSAGSCIYLCELFPKVYACLVTFCSHGGHSMSHYTLQQALRMMKLFMMQVTLLNTML